MTAPYTCAVCQSPVPMGGYCPNSDEHIRGRPSRWATPEQASADALNADQIRAVSALVENLANPCRCDMSRIDRCARCEAGDTLPRYAGRLLSTLSAARANAQRQADQILSLSASVLAASGAAKNALAELQDEAARAAVSNVLLEEARAELDRVRHEVMDRDTLLRNEHALYAREHDIAEAWKALARAARDIDLTKTGEAKRSLRALGINPDAEAT